MRRSKRRLIRSPRQPARATSAAHRGQARGIFSITVLPSLSRTATRNRDASFVQSIATLALVSRPICRHSSINCTQTHLIAGPLSLRKLAIVL
jgi:hypothetical protein